MMSNRGNASTVSPMGAPSVLLITPRWTRDGGVGAHVQSSAGALAAQGLRVGVLVARMDGDMEVSGVRVHQSAELFNTSVAIDVRLGGAVEFAPDVIHLHQVDDPALVAGLRLTAPVVSSAHAYTACTSGVHYFRPGQECARAHGPGCIPNLMFRGCAHTANPTGLPSRYARVTRALRALRSVDLAVAYSTTVARHLAVNGIERRAIVPLFTTMLAARGSAQPAARRVLFAGRIVGPKGVGVLIRAARDVDGEFVICGEGRMLESMRALARRLGVERRIVFRGWLDPDALARELAEASVVVVPSVWPEPFGLVGIEALAAGRPVVASATGGIGDWLEAGVTGLEVPPGDAAALAGALNELLGDPERQRKMGIAGREMVADRFTPERHVEALLDAYRAARASWISRARSG